MREVGKQFRHLGFAALVMLAASAAGAQIQQLWTGQRNPACGSPTSIGDGRSAATPESVSLDGSALCGLTNTLTNFIIPYIRDNNTRQSIRGRA